MSALRPSRIPGNTTKKRTFGAPSITLFIHSKLVKQQDFMIDGERSGSLPGAPRFPGGVKVLIKMAALSKGELLVKT